MESNMNKKLKNGLKTLAPAFTWERVICRLIAAWCSFAAINLIRDGNFFDISFAQDTSLGRVFFLSLIIFLLYATVNLLLPAYETDTWFLMLSSTICVIRWLSAYQSNFSNGEFIFTLAVIVVFSLFAVYFVQKNDFLWKKWNPGKRTVWIASIVCGVACGFIIAAITCCRYLTFSSPNFDFGLFVNMFHNMKETGLPLSTAERDVLLSHFVVHISPIYYLLLPFYFIFPSPLTLQIGQALVLASGVIPVMLLCRHFKLSGKVTILVTAIYALYPALSAGCFYDIHENCFLTSLLLWMFYFFEREKYPWMYLFAFLTLMVKEDAAIYVILFALYVLLSRKKFLHGGILALGALAYFGIALTILEMSSAHYAELYANATPNPPIAGPMVNRFNNMIPTGSDAGLMGVVKTALVNPGFLLTQLFATEKGGWEKIMYLIQLFLPLGLLPFCSKKASRWLLIVPVLMNFLTMYQYQYDIGFQYHFGIIAFLIYVSIINLPEMKAPNRQTLVTIGAVACCCFYLVTVMPKYTSYTDRWQSGKATYRKMEQILDTVPEDASVCCSSFLLAHLADRDEVYELRYHGNEPDVDYVVVDQRNSGDQKYVNAYLNKGYIVKEDHEKLILILQKADN